MSNQQNPRRFEEVHVNPQNYPIYPTYAPAPVTVPPTTVVVTNTVVNYGSHPQHHILCPYCRANVTTKVETKATNRTHIAALVLCCVCCWPCVCLPYCMESCQSVHHYCPSCNAFLGCHNN